MYEVIAVVLPVQSSLPPPKERGLELPSQDEKSSFVNKMDEQGQEQLKTEKTKIQEVPQEEKTEHVLMRKFAETEEPHMGIKKEEKKTIEELLIAVPEQMLALEKLCMQPELLYQYIQKIQELYQTYGNIKLNELPADQLQKLQVFLSDINITNAICMEDTIQATIEKLIMPEKLLQAPEMVQTEIYDITKKQGLQEAVEQLATENLEAEHLETVTLPDLDTAEPTGAESFGKPIVLGADQTVTNTGSAEKVTLPDLGKKMEAQVEALQKFVVKQERVLFQLNPEKLGTVTVLMKKHGDQIDVHVEVEKHDAKKRIEIIFDELKLKLKEKEIHIEISYSDKDQQRKEQNQQQKQRQKQTMLKQEQESKQDFAGLLEE